MAQIVKGSVVRKTGAGGVSHGIAMKHQEQVAASGNGMIVGAVVNKPVAPPQVPAAMALPQGVQGHIASQGHKVDVKQIHVHPTLLKPINQQQQQSQSVGKSDADHQSNGAQQEQTLANTKEKTPMCLINELARFNKIQHQYTLTDEQGPAHKKTFYVKLKLGDEEYAANGPSIKKAQHAAAAIALGKTQYKHPPPKPPKRDSGTDGYPDSITPTVELNAIAMKRGEPAVYRAIEMPRAQYGISANMDFRGMYNQRYHYPKHPRIFYVSLKVGQREFIGEGNTRQTARHNAAFKALKILRALPLPTHDGKPQQQEEAITTPPTPETNGVTVETKEKENGEDDLKSEISLVHEIALKRNMPVNFEVMRESGPPHIKTFVTRCTVGKFVTEGEGNGKKLSKKRAAEKMLEELKSLPQLPQTAAKSKKAVGNKKKNRNLIKVTPHLQKANPDYGVGINPISRLIQIQQAKKEKEPVYTLIREGGLPRKREFDMQVQVGDHIATGVGPNKKLAKRNAAEAMLQLLGYSRPAPQPSKPAIKSGEGQVVSDKKVTFMEADGNTTEVAYTSQYGERSKCQMIPGIILMPDGRSTQSGMGQPFGANQSTTNRSPGQYPGNVSAGSKKLPQATATIAKELLESGVSPTAESIVKTGAKPLNSDQKTVKHKQQLLYLSDVLGFQVQFTDFPKGSNRTDYLSLVTLSTNPQHVSHGSGLTIEESHDMAALAALKWLSEFGLDSVSNKKNVDNMGAGDGPHVKVEKTG